MVKSEQDVVKEFNEVVNMTADEIEAFLKTGDSEGAGWTKDDGSGESVGHESGRKIVDILKRNPNKDPSKYTDEDKEHMRKVVSYCARHLAQEGHMKEEKTEDELKQTKSYKSLKNWGHDPLKSSSGSGSGSGGKSTAKPKSSGKPASKAAPKAESKDKADKADKADKEEKPKSSGKPASKKADAAPTNAADKPKSSGKPASKKGGAASTTKKDETSAEAGDKRAAPAPVPEGEGEGGGEAKKEDAKAEKSAKPASKKAKTEKPPSEPSRKPPSRSAKKSS